MKMKLTTKCTIMIDFHVLLLFYYDQFLKSKNQTSLTLVNQRGKGQKIAQKGLIRCWCQVGFNNRNKKCLRKSTITSYPNQKNHPLKMCNIRIKNYQCNENIKSNVSYNASTISQKNGNNSIKNRNSRKLHIFLHLYLLKKIYIPHTDLHSPQ